MSATYRDIQTLTGLSLATISKYFNGQNVRPKNAAAIEAAAAELNFRVNKFAQSLRTQRSMTVGVLLPALANSFHAAIISETGEALMRHGYGMIVGEYTSDEGHLEEAAEFLLERMIDGLIMVPFEDGTRPPELDVRHRGVPIVSLDRADPHGFDSVVVDNRGAGRMVADRLLEFGHHDIGILAGPAALYSTQNRTAGARERFAERGVRIPDSRVVHSALTAEAARVATHALLEGANPPSAIFATNAETTVGAAIALNEMRLRTPDAVSFVGFDNLDLARAVPPGLEIVTQPVAEIADEASRLLLRRMAGDDEAETGVHVVLPCKLHPGGSVGVVPGL